MEDWDLGAKEESWRYLIKKLANKIGRELIYPHKMLKIVPILDVPMLLLQLVFIAKSSKRSKSRIPLEALFKDAYMVCL